MTYTSDERKTLRAASEIKRRARKQAKKARPVNPKKDRGRVRDPGFLAFLRRQSCTVCHKPAPCDAAHIRMHLSGERPTGLSRKPDDARCVSLCRGCHSLQHSMSERAFWFVNNLDPFQIAASLHARYLAEGKAP